MLDAETFVFLLFIALVPGVLAFELAMRRVPSFGGARRVWVPLAFTLYGYLPAAVITVGLAPQSFAMALAAIAFFLLFGVSVSINESLHAAIFAAREVERREQAITRGASPNSLLERTPEE
jgi:preprotein translocase subunit SecY